MVGCCQLLLFSFRQYLDACGNQSETDAHWSPEEFLEKLPLSVQVTVAGRQVQVQAWRYLVRSEFGHFVPVYFLGTSVLQNMPWDQSLTDHLYGGDARYRLSQEVILGFAGVAMLRALGHVKVQAYHMNEGHSALVTLALLEEQTWGHGLHAMEPADREAVSQRCVFTTHTPLPVGHDEFPVDLVREVLGNERTNFLIEAQCCGNGVMNMTNLALSFSRYVNGVSMRHEEVTRTDLPPEKESSSMLDWKLRKGALDGQQVQEATRQAASAGSPNPFASMLTQTIQPYLSQVFANMFGMFAGFGQPPGMMPPGTPPPQGTPTGFQQPQPGQSGFQQPTPGFQEVTEDEVKEAFNDE